MKGLLTDLLSCLENTDGEEEKCKIVSKTPLSRAYAHLKSKYCSQGQGTQDRGCETEELKTKLKAIQTEYFPPQPNKE